VEAALVRELTDRELSVARDILSYLSKNPEAKDTMEGIARFWLAHERLDISMGEVDAGVRFLVDRALVIEKVGLAERPYYQIASGRHRAVANTLSDLKRSAGTEAANGYGTGDPARQVRLASQLGNLAAGGLYAAALYFSIGAWGPIGSPTAAAFFFWNALLVLSLLVRYQAASATVSVANWIIAPLTQILLLLLSVERQAVPPSLVIGLSSIGQIMGLGLMTACLIGLNRSVGIVAADRGIKTRGLYAIVRHPWYASEFLFVASFLLGSPSLRNLIVAAGIVYGEFLRAAHEEAFLAQDERYRIYREAVPRRFVPDLRKVQRLLHSLIKQE
jgi:protein-S-isoprenylcysteine O-methyltransferase Ste14